VNYKRLKDFSEWRRDKMEVCISEFSVRHRQILLNMFLLNQKHKIVIEMDLDLSSDG